MTRQEIFQSYTIQDQTIQDPGKFESEPMWAPYFWDSKDDGEILDDPQMSKVYYELPITPDDRLEWPELPHEAVCIVLTSTEEGFVGCAEFTKTQLAELTSAVQEDSTCQE